MKEAYSSSRLTVFAGKDGSIGDHFGQNTADRPNVDRLGVPFAVQHDFRSAIPTRGHVLRQETRVIMVRVSDAGQTEITDLQVTRRVQQQVAGFQVPMQNVR